jgi:hypothetical protein
MLMFHSLRSVISNISEYQEKYQAGNTCTEQQSPVRNDPLSDHDDPVDHKPDCGEDQQSNGPVEKATEKSAVNVAAGIQVTNDSERSKIGYKANNAKNCPFIQGIDGQRKWVGKLVKNEAE